MDCNLKTEKTTVNINGEEYRLDFTFNSIADLQEKFNTSIDNVLSLFYDEAKDISTIRSLLFLMVNEGIEIDNDENGTSKQQFTDERKVFRMIKNETKISLMDKIATVLNNSLPTPKEEDVIPNAESGQ